MTEILRAIRGKVVHNPALDLAALMRKAEVVLQETALQPLNRLALWRAGGIFDPHLDALDGIHVMTAGRRGA